MVKVVPKIGDSFFSDTDNYIFRMAGVCTVDCFNMILLKMKYCTKIKRGMWDENDQCHCNLFMPNIKHQSFLTFIKRTKLDLVYYI